VVVNGLRANSARASPGSPEVKSGGAPGVTAPVDAGRVRNHLLQRALTYAQELERDPKCRFSDRLFFLDALQLAGDEHFAGYLAIAATGVRHQLRHGL